MGQSGRTCDAVDETDLHRRGGRLRKPPLLAILVILSIITHRRRRRRRRASHRSHATRADSHHRHQAHRAFSKANVPSAVRVGTLHPGPPSLVLPPHSIAHNNALSTLSSPLVIPLPLPLSLSLDHLSTMAWLFSSLYDWLSSLFFAKHVEITIVGLQVGAASGGS